MEFNLAFYSANPLYCQRRVAEQRRKSITALRVEKIDSQHPAAVTLAPTKQGAEGIGTGKEERLEEKIRSSMDRARQCAPALQGEDAHSKGYSHSN